MTASNVWQTQPGFFNTNSYLSPGIPFLTGSTLLSSSFGQNQSEQMVSFEKITKSITVVNKSSPAIQIAFNSNVSGNVFGGHHYFTLSNLNDSVTFNVRCKEIYLSLATGSANGTYEMFAELTTINNKDMPNLTGSGLTI